MKSILLAAAAVACLAPTASAQTARAAVEKALTGTWTCSGEGSGMKVTSKTTYLAGGKETYEVAVNASGGQLEFTATGAADWKLAADGKLVETITTLAVKTARMGGQDAAPATVQSMIEPMILNQVTTSAVELKDGAMLLTDQDGVVQTCKR
jgi:hypothetical protein